MADISQVTLPDGSVYNLKDSTARTVVKQTAKSDNKEYKILTTSSNSPTSGANAEVAYDTGVTINPSTHTLTATNLKGILSTQDLKRPTGLRGLNDVTLQALVNNTRANRLAFLPADQIIIEKTTDGGTTWVDAGVSDAEKLGLFSETRTPVYLPMINGARSILCGLRITITAMKYNVPNGTSETEKYNYWNSTYVNRAERYCQLKDVYFWLNAINDSIGVTVQRATGANSNTWVNIFNDTSYYMTGWSGCDYINFGQNTFGGGTTQTGNYWNYRIILMTKGVNGTNTMATSSTTQQQSIMEIRGYGDNVWTVANNYMTKDHIYSFDANQNATFPKQVTATKFIGALQGNADTATSAGKLQNTSKVGDTNKPVYFTANGVPAAISYTIDKSVPSSAVFTDTTYTFADGTAGNFTVTPSGGSAQTVSIGKPATAGTADSATKATNDSDNNAINTTYIKKSVLSGAYDVMYSSAANTPTRLAANTSTTKKFLRMTGTGSAGTAPTWDTVGKSDVGLGNVDNVKQYSASNPPPYPVTSVNGSTGAVTVSVPFAYTSNPAMNGTASPGSSGAWARGDHVHPSDTSRVPVNGMGKNLLDNWYFVGGGTGPGVFPINQRQVFAVTSNSMYFIDRWRAGFIDGYSCSLTSTGIVTTNSSSTAVIIYQTIDNYGKQLLGKQVTCSIQTTAGTYIASGTVPSTFNNSGLVISVRDANSNIIGGLNVSSSDIQFRLRTPENLNVTFVAAKLELGNLSTLVINNVLTEIPDYDEELLKCQTAITTATDIYANKIVSVNTPNPNLLDNWYFVGGGSASQNEGSFPINQIGATTYTSGYTIDRWKFTADSQMVLTLDSGKIRLTKSTNSANPKWVQIINDDTLVGKTATFSILYKASYTASNQLQISIGRSASKTVPVSTSDYNICSVTGVIAKDTWGSVTDSIYVGVSLLSGFVATTDYIDILAAKLELGTQQTLAYLAGSSWVLTDFPNYENEFIKCLTSSADPYDYLSNKAIAVDNSNENLLSNWYFKKSQTRGGQLPINTRNLNTINTGKAYLIDNWAIFDGSGTASLSTNGITLVGSGNWLRFGTQIPFWKIEGREITLSIMIKSITSGTVDVFLGESSGDIVNNYSPTGMGSITTTTAGNFWVYGRPTRNSSGNANDLCNILIRVTNGCTAVIEAIKLEYGTVQTLFKQEGGTAVLRDIPDYSLEYQKCITNSVQAKDLYANQRAGIIEIKCSSVSSTSLTYYHPLIRSTDTVLTYMLSQPHAQRAAITVTTYDGRLTFSNAFVSNTATDITLVLGSSLPTLTATTS